MFYSIRSFIIFALTFPGLFSYASTDWPNEPAGSTPVYDCPFSDSLCGLGNTYNTQDYASPGGSGNTVSAPRAFDYYMGIGSITGSGQWGLSLNKPKEIYLGFVWSTNADFMGNNGAANKMLFIRNSEMDNNFVHWKADTPGTPKVMLWSNQATYDNCGIPGTRGMCYSAGDGTGDFFPNVNTAAATLSAGSGWHKIEFYIKTSTSKTSKDGILRWWVDGVMVANYLNINMTPGGPTEFQINSTWDGFNTASRDTSKAWHHYYDHIRISVPNCGSNCGGIAVPPVPSLNKPTNLKLI